MVAVAISGFIFHTAALHPVIHFMPNSFSIENLLKRILFTVCDKFPFFDFTFIYPAPPDRVFLSRVDITSSRVGDQPPPPSSSFQS